MVIGEAYVRLPTLFEAIKEWNPSTVYHIEPHQEKFVMVDNVRKPIFDHAFWCFGQCVEAFRHCRSLLSVDATFLTGKYKLTLMTAICADGEDQLLALAFALGGQQELGMVPTLS
jgi:hypothetical protein